MSIRISPLKHESLLKAGAGLLLDNKNNSLSRVYWSGAESQRWRFRGLRFRRSLVQSLSAAADRSVLQLGIDTQIDPCGQHELIHIPVQFTQHNDAFLNIILKQEKISPPTRGKSCFAGPHRCQFFIPATCLLSFFF